MQFKRNLGSHWIQNGRVPELAVAYDLTSLTIVVSGCARQR
jgi:hypothetical protein